MIKNKASLLVGAFLAYRDLKRSNIWTTLLVIFVMSLTFFNMLLMGGLLMGITAGMEATYKNYYSSDIRITPSTKKSIIYQTQDILQIINNIPELKAYSVHYNTPVLLEYGYKTKIKKSDLVENVVGELVGIDPIAENRVTHLANKVVSGSYLNATDTDSILLGKDLVEKYSGGAFSKENILVNVDVGSKIRLSTGTIQKEVIVKGIIDTKNRIVDSRMFMTDTAVRGFIDNKSLNADEIIISLEGSDNDVKAKDYILKNINNPDEVLVQTADEAIPSASADINKTFLMLSNIIGLIALIVGAITIFIVIFVNAITRRKYIGILKGIGISARAIQISYIIQSLIYAGSGVFFGSIIIMLYLKPYLDIHPINMPIANGSLAITYTDLWIRGVILIITAFISGFVPAWIVTRQNTLDAILGR